MTLKRKPAKTRMSRRNFLKGAAAAIAGPLVLPASVLGLDGHTPPSDRITVAVIGIGSMGSQHLKVDALRDDMQIVAVCDVWRDRREGGKKAVEEAYAQQRRVSKFTGVDAYNDFREILARPDIDGVMIVTWFHWHVTMGILAAQAGKHVYLEKTAAISLGEGRALVNAINRYGVAFQHGTGMRSCVGPRRAAELVRSGRIGKVIRAESSMIDMGKSHPRSDPMGRSVPPAQGVAIPDGLDWDLALGPCSWRPFPGVKSDTDPLARGCRPRQAFDTLAHYAIHPLDAIQMSLGMDDTGPVSITPAGIDGQAKLSCRYANGVELVPAELDPEINTFGYRLVGSEGTLTVNRDYCLATPDNLGRAPSDPEAWRYQPAVSDAFNARTTNQVVMSNNHEMVALDADLGAHKGNWLHCIRTGERTNAHVESAQRSSAVTVLLDMAHRLGRTLKWDPLNESFIGDDEANRLRDYPKRAPWQVY